MISDYTIEVSKKQGEALTLLMSRNGIREICYGGGARGGKSFLGALWIVSQCLKLPGSQWLIGRKTLKKLRTVLVRQALMPVMKSYQLVEGKHYNYNRSDSIIEFINGSAIYMADLDFKPSDPEYDRLLGMSLTGFWIDEAQEVELDCKDALITRLSETSGKGWRVEPKVLLTCNPSVNWIYSEFYKPWKENRLRPGRLFLKALYSDNPYIDQDEYREVILATGNEAKIQRLLQGNFEYNDDPAILYNRIDMEAAFVNFTEPDFNAPRHLVIDVAGEGQDWTVAMVWYGYKLQELQVLPKNTPEEFLQFAEILMRKHNIHPHNVLCDGSGLGFFTKLLRGTKQFKGGTKNFASSPDNHLHFHNLKAQCAFRLRYLLQNKLLDLSRVPRKYQDRMMDEARVFRHENWETDDPFKITSKKDILPRLGGKSPDMIDTLIMSAYFFMEDLHMVEHISPLQAGYDLV